MPILIAAATATSVALLVMIMLESFQTRALAVKVRKSEMGLHGLFDDDAKARRTRQRSKLQDLLHLLGESMEKRQHDWGRIRMQLVYAGYREPAALPLYLGIRFGATGIVGVYGLLIGAAAGLGPGFTVLSAICAAGAGWMVPRFVLSSRVTRRQKELQKALPDAIDLLVICVEAGLGLNQAMMRVAEEIRHISHLMTEELALTNVAIRAGTPRDQALMGLAERTGLADIRSLVTMIVQTERFGTSIAHSLRVHSESMRTKRRQRAEEAAAKTTIKMIFPLTFCIFPALFVVVLGPAFIGIFQTFSKLN